MAITLYSLAQSRAQRILWLLELLDMEVEFVQFERDPATLLAPEEVRRIHPLGKLPLLRDGDRVLAESGVIIDYLIQTYGQGRLMPARDHADYWEYQRWLHYAEASLMPLLLLDLVFARVVRAPVPFFIKPVLRKVSGNVHESFIDPQLALQLAHVNEALAGRRWFMGDELTGADVMMSYPLQAAAARVGVDAYPNITAFVARIEADPAWQRVVARAGSPTGGIMQGR